MISHSKPTVSKKDLMYVLESMLEDRLESGHLVEEFERLLQQKLKSGALTALSSRSAALYLIAKRENWGTETRVLLPAIGDKYLLDICSLFQVQIQFYDFIEDSLVPDLSFISQEEKEQYQALILVNQWGALHDFTAIREAWSKLTLIEDASYSLGSLRDEQMSASLSDYSLFDFSEKSIITTSKGAVLCSKVKKNISEIKKMRDGENCLEVLGLFDFRMTELQAAMGISELSLLDKFIKKRNEIATYYSECIERSPNEAFIPDENTVHNWAFYPVRFKSALKMVKELLKKYQIEFREAYACHLAEMQNQPVENFPQANQRKMSTLLLPIYPLLSREEIESVGKILANIR